LHLLTRRFLCTFLSFLFSFLGSFSFVTTFLFLDFAFFLDSDFLLPFLFLGVEETLTDWSSDGEKFF
jgi:hypothetical protein